MGFLNIGFLYPLKLMPEKYDSLVMILKISADNAITPKFAR